MAGENLTNADGLLKDSYKGVTRQSGFGKLLKARRVKKSSKVK